MKHSVLATVSGLCAAVLSVSGGFAAEESQEITPIQPAPQVQEAPKPAAPANVAFGVDEVVKLTRAQISEDVIATYIQSSGQVYNLRPTDIVTLHQQGVSDRLVTLMLSQGHLTPPVTNAPVMLMPAPMAPMVAQEPAAPAPDQNQVFIPGQNAFEIAAAGPPVMVEPQSTVYVIPDTTRSGFAYRPVYSYFGSFNTFGCVSPVIRIGGFHHRAYSFHHR
jgi:hypothetical protein